MHPGHTNNGFYSEKRLHRDDAGIHPVALGRGQTVQRVPQTAEPLLELQNLVRGRLVQAGGIFDAVLAAQRILRELPLVGRLVAGDALPGYLQGIPAHLHNLFLPVVPGGVDKNTHHSRIVLQHIVRRTANEHTGSCLRNVADGPFLRHDGTQYGVGGQIQLPHDSVFIRVGIGDKFLRQTALLGGDGHQLFVITGNAQPLGNKLADPFPGRSMLPRYGDDYAFPGRPDHRRRLRGFRCLP